MPAVRVLRIGVSCGGTGSSKSQAGSGVAHFDSEVACGAGLRAAAATFNGSGTAGHNEAVLHPLSAAVAQLIDGATAMA